jgi:hypothetical protein
MSTRYDVAVLFVHGIGEQKPGETLADFGGALVATGKAWHDADDVECARQPAAAGVPLHAELLLRRGGRETRALLVESHWAGEVRAPTWPTLMKWLGSVVPFLVQRAADQLLRRTSRQIDRHAAQRRAQRQRRGRLRYGLVEALFDVARVALNVPAVLATIAISALLQLLGLAGLIAHSSDWVFGRRLLGTAVIVAIVLAPFAAGLLALDCSALAVAAALGALIVLARRAQSLLVGFIGDSYALLHAGGSAAEIERRVRDDLAWIERQHEGVPVIVIAHSQGSEVVHRVLAARAAGDPVAGLVTFGSAIAKLYAVGELRRKAGRAWAAFGLRLLSGALLAVAVAAALAGGGLMRLWALPVLVLAVLTLRRARCVLQEIVGTDHAANALKIGRERVAHWTDLHASHDLVSEGDLPVQARTRGYSRTVVNRRSLVLDHVTYWPNVEGFQAAIALELERVVEGREDPLQRGELGAAAAARTRWINAIYALRTGTGLAAIALCVALAPSLCGVLAIALGAGLAYVGMAALLHARVAARTRALLAGPG